MKFRRLLPALLSGLTMWTTATGCGVLEARLLSSGLRHSTSGPALSEDPFAGMPLQDPAVTAQTEQPENQPAELQTAALADGTAAGSPVGRTFLPGHLVEPASAVQARTPNQLASTGRVVLPGQLASAGGPSPSTGNVMQASWQSENTSPGAEPPRVLIPHGGRRLPADAPKKLVQGNSTTARPHEKSASAPPFPAEEQQTATAPAAAPAFPQRPVRLVAAAPRAAGNPTESLPGGAKPAGAMTAGYNPPKPHPVTAAEAETQTAAAAAGDNPFAPASPQSAASPETVTADAGWRPRSETPDQPAPEKTQADNGAGDSPPGEEWSDPR